jgi:N-hydroxyarylamine O-acetyltransferase
MRQFCARPTRYREVILTSYPAVPEMNTSDYLQRIKYDGPLTVNSRTLRELQLAHLLTVPFENLSIHYAQPILLNDDALYEKIVTRRRGGFCYELNGLFAALLRALGFDVTMLSARVANAEGVFGPEFDHMTLLITLDQRWLVDVGFGDSFREPLLFDEQRKQIQGQRSYRLVTDGAEKILMQRDNAGEDKAQYRFTLEPHTYPDYEEMCRFHQTSPESHFTRKRICSLATTDGRITLSDMTLITTTESHGRQEQLLRNDEEYRSILREHFNIEL